MRQAAVSDDGTEEPFLLSVADSAKRLRVSEDSVWRAIQDGTLKSVRVGRRHMVQMASLRKLAGLEA
jgi:excisionase family DNA binding protein